jgi:hypothetical protein
MLLDASPFPPAANPPGNVSEAAPFPGVRKLFHNHIPVKGAEMVGYTWSPRGYTPGVDLVRPRRVYLSFAIL